MGSCICSSRIHGEDTVAKCKMEIIGDELIISNTNGLSEEKRHPLQNLVAVSFEGEILRLALRERKTCSQYNPSPLKDVHFDLERASLGSNLVPESNYLVWVWPVNELLGGCTTCISGDDRMAKLPGHSVGTEFTEASA